jgi:Uma2 family endonuclease
MAGMTIEEFIRAYKKESPFELVDGEIRPLRLMVAGHTTVLKNIYDPLSQHVNAHGLGEIYYRLPYVITDADRFVTNSRTPDLMFISKERFEKYKTEHEDWEDKPMLIVPDFAVQISFYGDDNGYEKALLYRQDSVQMHWNIEVQYRRIMGWWGSSAYPHILRINEPLTGEDVIPGFSISTTSIFQSIIDENEDLRIKAVEQIETAFVETPYPGDENISTDRDEIDERILRSKHWRDLSLETIYKVRNGLSFLTPEAYRFYLPAFMRATLLHYYQVDTLSSSLISHLSPEKRGDQLYNFFLSMNGNFNRVEQQAIVAFLEALFSLYPEEFAEWNTVYRPMLNSGIEYWKNRLKAEES